MSIDQTRAAGESLPVVLHGGEVADAAALADDLRSSGFAVTVEPSVAEDQLHAPLGELAIHLVESVGDEVLGILVGVALGWLSRRRRGRAPRSGQRVVIYDKHGQPLRFVEVPEPRNDG